MCIPATSLCSSVCSTSQKNCSCSEACTMYKDAIGNQKSASVTVPHLVPYTRLNTMPKCLSDACGVRKEFVWILKFRGR